MAMAVIFLVLGAVLLAFNFNQKVYVAGEAGAEITQNGRVLLERLTRETRQAKEIATEFSLDEAQATSTIMFEDGHSPAPYHYIRYWRDEASSQMKREAVGFFFSGDPGQTLMAYDAVPPLGQTLEKKSLETPQAIGEFVSQAKFWGDKVIYFVFILEKSDQQINLKSSVFGRNF